VENTPILRSARYDKSCGGCCRAGKRKNGATFPASAAAMCTALMPHLDFNLGLFRVFGVRVARQIVMRPGMGADRHAGCVRPGIRRLPSHSSASALSMAGVLPGHDRVERACRCAAVVPNPLIFRSCRPRKSS